MAPCPNAPPPLIRTMGTFIMRLSLCRLLARSDIAVPLISPGLSLRENRLPPTLTAKISGVIPRAFPLSGTQGKRPPVIRCFPPRPIGVPPLRALTDRPGQIRCLRVDGGRLCDGEVSVVYALFELIEVLPLALI